MRAVAIALLACAGCPAPKGHLPEPSPPDAAASRAPAGPAAPSAEADDRAACDRLCAREQACSGAPPATCVARCRADAARMKPGFVSALVTCFVAALDAKCGGGGMSDADRLEAHDRCFDEAVARYPRDHESQRHMAEAVCDRGRRCHGFDALAHDACLRATLDPQEPEVKLGQRLVDALRPDRVRAFRACVDASPCPGVDLHDDAVELCHATTIALEVQP